MAIVTIISIIITASLSVALLILAGIYRKYFKDNLENVSSGLETKSNLAYPLTVSVSEYISKISLPAIAFNCKGKKLLFILDTGSDGCHINKSVISELEVESYFAEQKEGEESYIATGNGVSAPSSEYCDLELSLGEYNFNVFFSVDEWDAAFDYIFRTEGVQLHGILGTNFLRANNWTIDFTNEVAYQAFQKKQ